jgi:hypothetical protein
VPLADVNDAYTDLVTTFFSTTIAAKVPAGIVAGQDEADVVAYVVSIANP